MHDLDLRLRVSMLSLCPNSASGLHEAPAPSRLRVLRSSRSPRRPARETQTNREMMRMVGYCLWVLSLSSDATSGQVWRREGASRTATGTPRARTSTSEGARRAPLTDTRQNRHTGKAVDFSLPPAIRRHERTSLTPKGCTLIGSACRRRPASPGSPCSLAAPPPLLSRGRRGAARRW